MSCTLQLPIDSQATGARQRPDGASDELGGSRQVVRRASTTEEATLMNGHHGARLLCATAYETPFGPVLAHRVHVQTPLAVLQLQARAKRAADGVTEAVRCRSGRFAHAVGQSPSEEALSARWRNRTRGRAALDYASCATAPRRRGLEAAASFGRDNPTHETDDKEAAKTGARGGPEEHTHVENFGGNAGGAAGGKGNHRPFLRRRPETEDVHKGPGDDVRKEAGLSR